MKFTSNYNILNQLPKTLLGLSLHRPFTLHADELASPRPRERAADRHRLRGIARDRDADQVFPRDQRIGRIELDPAGAGQIDLGPSVSRARALHGLTVAVERGIVEIAGDETRAEAERARRLDEQQRVVAAGPALALQRLD